VEITSALSIVVQLINFLGKDNVDRQLKSLGPRDVLIQPDLGDISAGSFDRSREAIKIGEATARAMADSLRRYSVSENEYASLRKTQLAEKHTLGKIDEIRFEGVERTRPEVLAAVIESKPGEELSEDKIAADLRRIYGRGDFDAVDYRIEQGPGSRALVIHVREKEIGPNYLRFGLGLASDSQGEAIFNALISYRRTWVNRLGGEFVAEAQVGQNTYLFSEFYQPFEARGRLFSAAYGQVGQYTRPVFVNDDRIAEYLARETRFGLDVGANLGTWGEARIGPLYRDVRSEVETGPPVLPEIKANASGVRMRVFGDRLDGPWFPRSGHRAALTAFSTASALGADESYQRYEGLFTAAGSIGSHTLSATIRAAPRWIKPSSVRSIHTGGPFRLSAIRSVNSPVSQWHSPTSLLPSDSPMPSLIGSGIYVGGSVEA
jgi:NTE family protein